MNEPYRVGIIGCGRIASTMQDQPGVMQPVTIAGAFAALPNARIVAACNRGEEKLHAFGQRWGVRALYQNYREMLQKEKLDIVCVATHPPGHMETVVAAAQAGAKGIFCEKPMALDLFECNKMVQACSRAGTKLLINCSRRWSKSYRAAKDLISSGELGPLLHVLSHCQGCKPFPEWVADTEGPLLHDAVHTFDTLRMFAGDVTSVLGTATRRMRRDLRVEDTSYALLRFANGIDGVVITDELTEYERWDIEFQCERGVIRMGMNAGLWRSQPEAFEAGTWCELVSDSLPKDILPEPAWPEARILHAARDLIACIEEDRSPACAGEDGRAAIEIVMAIYESERRGNTWVDLPLRASESGLEVLRREGKL